MIDTSGRNTWNKFIFFCIKFESINNKSGVAADTSGHQLAQQFLMYASLTSLKEDFFTTPVTHKMNKICILKLFELQGLKSFLFCQKRSNVEVTKWVKFVFLDLQTSFHQVGDLQNEQSLFF